jgi:signal transduction histidine kinase
MSEFLKKVYNIKMNKQFNQKRQRSGWIFGLAAGVAFALSAWGIDAIKLSNAHLAFPFMKFLPGLVICALAGSLVGWLSIRIGKTWVSLVLWLGFAILANWLTIWLLISATPALISYFQPNLSNFLDYATVENLHQFRVIGMIVIGVPCFLCGFLEFHMVDQAMASSSSGGLISMILFCAVIMAVAGLASDEMLNRNFREPVQALDELFQFAQDNAGKEVDKTIARRKHLRVVEDLGNLVQNPRKLTLIAYDATLGQMDMLVDFGGTWVRCTTIYSQPTKCDLVTNLSLKQYFSVIDWNFTGIQPLFSINPD